MTSPVVVSRIQNRRGTQAQFDALYPPGYTGIGGAVGTQILQPGEIALCTDTRKVFIGNLNGEYLELTKNILPPGNFLPLTVVLPPAASFTVIPELSFNPTPFFTIIYSVTDVVNPDPNIVGNQLSINGQLQITAIVPGPGNATLTDTSTEVNNTSYSINFQADYDLSGTLIEISYIHNYPTDLTFNTSSIVWAPL